ncbi:TPA: DUF1932 domain-containing protein [Raoultella ornithinolytica]
MSTIAILYPGQMGRAFAALLRAAGHETISPMGCRSEKTQKSAREIGIGMRDSMAYAVVESDLILSLVPPSAVVEVAHQAIRACREKNAMPVFIDLNAKTPADAEYLSRVFDQASLPFCNACIIGRASHLGEEGRIYVSGPDTMPIEKLFKGILPVIRLGDEIVQASIFKMVFAGFNKAVTAALFETANTANAFDVTDPLFELLEYHLGSTLSDLRKLVPTYPHHITRRAEEMEALAQMLSDSRLPNKIALAAGVTFRSLGSSDCWSGAETSPQFMELLLNTNYRVTSGKIV